MEEKTRSFIAVELPDHIRQAILNIQNRLKSNIKGIKWVLPDKIHLTLRFLGDLDKSEIEAVKEAIDTAAGTGSPFLLSARGIGAFPGLTRPRIIWIGLGGGLVSLSELYLNLENQLEAAGVIREERKFKAHLTIGRVKGKVDTVRLVESIKSFKDFEIGTFSVNQIILFKSDLKPAGPVYTQLHGALLLT